MSFQEIFAMRTPPSSLRKVSKPKIVARPPEYEIENMDTNGVCKGKISSTRLRHRPPVLRCKVQDVNSYDTVDSDDVESNNSVPRETFRQSRYGQLATETQQFQKLVSEFISLLDECGETPEAAWRSRILGKSAQETDLELWQKLLQYERSLRVSDKGTTEELRTAQAACMKLHRDFKRSHKALLVALSEKERQQRAEISRLAAAEWSEEKEDFFDKAMREQELQQINTAVHHVNDIYKELTTLVETQQAQIDELEDNVAYAKDNVKAAGVEVGCLSLKERFLCGAFDTPDEEWGFLRQMDSGISVGGEKASPLPKKDQGVRVNEDFHWLMPFETLRQDMDSVKLDIVGLGEDVLRRVKRH